MSQQKRRPEGGTRESERRRTILRAAIDVFARKGYHGCRIADVASEAGVAYGLVYHYFKNKDELLETVFETGWSGFITRVRAVAEGEGTLEEKVRGIADVAFEAYRVDPRAVKVLILEIARSPAGGRVNRADGLRGRHPHVRADVHASAGSGRAAPGRGSAAGRGAALRRHRDGAHRASSWGCWTRADAAMLERAKEQIADSFLRGVLAEDAAAEAAHGRTEAGEVRYEVQGRQALLTIDRPRARNALSPAVMQGLMRGAGAGGGGPGGAGGGAHRRGGEGLLRGRRPRADGAEGGFLADARGPARVRRAAHAPAGRAQAHRGAGERPRARGRAGAGARVRSGRRRRDARSSAPRRSTSGSSPMMVMALLQRHVGRKRALELVMTGRPAARARGAGAGAAQPRGAGGGAGRGGGRARGEARGEEPGGAGAGPARLLHRGGSAAAGRRWSSWRRSCRSTCSPRTPPRA